MGEKESIISTKANTSTTKALSPEEGWAIAVPGCCSAQKAHLLEQHEHFSIHSSDWQLNKVTDEHLTMQERFTERFTCWSCRLHGRKSSRHETTRGQKSTQGYTRRQSTRTTTQHWVRTAHQSLRTAVRNHKQRWLVTVFFSFISLKKSVTNLGSYQTEPTTLMKLSPAGFVMTCEDVVLDVGRGIVMTGRVICCWAKGVSRVGCCGSAGSWGVGVTEGVALWTSAGWGVEHGVLVGVGVEGLGVPDPVEDDQRRKTK